MCKKIKTLAFHHLQTGNNVLFEPRSVVVETLFYKMRCFQASNDVFRTNYISSTESMREFFPRTLPRENTKKVESDRSDHTFVICKASVLHVNGCFIGSYSRTAMGKKC